MALPAVLKQPSALAPILMSLAALALVLGVVATQGVPHETDEGTAAHLFQLLMVAQVPVIGYFVAKWLPRDPRDTVVVLALQAAAILAALAPVYILGL